MGIDDLVGQGKQLFEDNKDKIDQFLKSEQAEQMSDQALDGAADLAKKIAPDQYDATVDDVRGKADEAIGNE